MTLAIVGTMSAIPVFWQLPLASSPALQRRRVSH